MEKILDKTLEFFKRNTYLLRILISGLFLLSAIAKLYPSVNIGFIKGFEYDQLIIGLGLSQDLAQYASRIILSLEFFIAIAILQSHFLKRIILPLSLILLSVFSFHLFVSILEGDTGNCGCFGQLIPMSPIEALIKNIISIFIIYFIFKYSHYKSRSRFSIITIIFLLSTLFMFIIAPLRSLETSKVQIYQQEKSIYSKYIPHADNGEKLICFFVPTCEHCQEVAAEITSMKNEIPCFPEVFISFMDEEKEKIPDFFEKAGETYNYNVLDITSFIEVFWNDVNDTPGIVYLNNGNLVKFYQGTKESGSENVFDVNDLRTVLENR